MRRTTRAAWAGCCLLAALGGGCASGPDREAATSFQQKDYLKALSLYREMEQTTPEKLADPQVAGQYRVTRERCAVIYHRQALEQADAGRLKEAGERLRQAQELDPGNAEVAEALQSLEE